MQTKRGVPDAFLRPSDEFSPMPFWFWNDDLSEAEIRRQIGAFFEKGINGFVIHPRMGLPRAIPYLGERWLSFVSFAVEEAARRGMRVILYDEAMYPSGSCHGEVVKCDPAFASWCLALREGEAPKSGEIPVAQSCRDGRTNTLVSRPSGGTIRGVHFGEDDGQPDAPRSADLLNPAAVGCFLRLTHERYYAALAPHFGETILGFFTDEPTICGRGCNDLPWTPGLEADLRQNGLAENDLFALFSEKKTEDAERVRQIFRRTVRERLSKSYYNRLADWCGAHGVKLFGHPAQSTDIALLRHFDVPCQDIVWRYVAPGDGSGVTGPHSTMAKCASDSARHRGKRRNGNECFGCCGHADDPFAFTRDDMKWYLDWLFVRGCNLIIPHAFFYSLRGERRAERPPDVGMHSAFWNEYREISDYIKRCSALNTDAVNMTDVAILCEGDRLPWRAAKALFEAQIEFNYLEEELLREANVHGGAFFVGNNAYRVLVLDGAGTDDAIPERFQTGGGIVLRYNGETDFAETVRRNSETCISLDTHPMLRMTHFKKEGSEFLFFTNEGEETIETTVRENVGFVLDAETGSVTPHTGETFALRLPPRKSLHLILESD